MSKWFSDCSHLSDERAGQLLDVLEKFDDVFVDNADDLLATRAKHNLSKLS